MDDVLSLAAELQRSGAPCALCTVVRVSGSVPRHEGSKLLASADGALLAGTIGGGLMEARVLERARALIAAGGAAVERYELNDPAQGDPGVCGGVVEVFIEALNALPQLLIVGAGHVGRALTHLAAWSGFRVTVADDRPGLATAEQCPGAARYISGDVLAQLDDGLLTPNTYVALVTRGYPLDVQIVPKLLASPARYIGVMGSKRRWLTAARELQAAGVSVEMLARVHAPLGLELEAETPEEIAVSIVAQLIAVRRGGDGRPMAAV
jgi:xanthine dehydrogenase accessory factor